MCLPILNVSANPIISGATPTSGTLISSTHVGRTGTNPSRGLVGGGTQRQDEVIFKSGTTYMIEIINAGNNANIIDYRANWYEHADKIKKF